MKGIRIFLFLIGFSILFCGVVPFLAMPEIDAAMALPVISVPGEKLWEIPVLGHMTNTMIGTLLADLLVGLLVFFGARKLKRVPGRLQMFVELLIGGMLGLATSIAGAKNGRKVFPLAATIFIFLLIANWIELIPGVDSIGLVHCAEEGMSGYRAEEGFLGMTYLKVSKNLDSGTVATHADYEACEAKYHGHGEEAEHAVVAPAAGEDSTHAEDSGEEGSTEEQAAEADVTEEAVTEAEVEAANPDIRIVTPFVRAAATDLNLTLALALIAVITIQYFGVAELKWGYVAKFINTPALEKGDVMGFGVGFLELISEFSKILSFGFRLFGNIFAGQVLLFVIPFLVATLLPGAIYGLELAVALIQAGVFAMLFMVFASIAMTSHEAHEEHH